MTLLLLMNLDFAGGSGVVLTPSLEYSLPASPKDYQVPTAFKDYQA